MIFDVIQPGSAAQKITPMLPFGQGNNAGDFFAQFSDQLSFASHPTDEFDAVPEAESLQIKGPSFDALDPFLSPTPCAVAPDVMVPEMVELQIRPGPVGNPEEPTQPVADDAEDGVIDTPVLPISWTPQPLAPVLPPPTAVTSASALVAPSIAKVSNASVATQEATLSVSALAATEMQRRLPTPKTAAKGELALKLSEPLAETPVQANPKAAVPVEALPAFVDAPRPAPLDQPSSNVIVPQPAAQPDPLSARQLDFALSDQWLADLASDIAAVQKDEGKLTFRLRPEQLGTMDVEVSRQEQRLVVEISAKNNGAENIISSALPRLEQELRSRGFAQVEAQVSGGGSQTPQRETHSQNRSPNLQIETERFAARKADRPEPTPSPAGLFA